ncbi:MAG: hypothetical protein WCP99_20005, partial [Burkholderiales bacterium]
ILLETTDLEWLKDGARDRHHSPTGEALFMGLSKINLGSKYNVLHNFMRSLITVTLGLEEIAHKPFDLFQYGRHCRAARVNRPSSCLSIWLSLPPQIYIKEKHWG